MRAKVKQDGIKVSNTKLTKKIMFTNKFKNICFNNMLNNRFTKESYEQLLFQCIQLII